MTPSRKVVVLVATLALLLTACGNVSASENLLNKYGLAGMNGQQIVEHLEAQQLQDRPSNLLASVRYDQLVLQEQPDGQEVQLELPEDQFYLSVAPFQQVTHDCYFHSLTTCLGELGDVEFNVVVTDQATGEVLVKETTRTNPNGFLGLWLPRDRKISLDLHTEHASGLSAENVHLATGPKDPTCITTVQLKP